MQRCRDRGEALPSGMILAKLCVVMNAKLLQVAGLVLLLSLAAAIGVGVFTLQDRVRIVVQADPVPSADPIQFLRDDLRILREDQQQLTTAIRENFGQLQQSWQEQGDRRQQDLLAAIQGQSQAVAALPSRLAAMDQRVERIERALAALAVAKVAEPQAAASQPAAPTPAPASAAVPADSVVPPIAAQPAPVPAAVAAPAASGPSLLGFKMADRKFAVDQLQTFEVVGELSRVGFDAKSTLHDFTGVTSQVAGTFRANLASPSGAWSGEVACEAATLVSGVDGRDDAMREHLDSAHHAQIRFAIAGFTPAQDGIDAKALTFRGEVRGTMTIRGKSREVAMPITARVDESKRLVVEGQMPLKLSDYGVPVPNKLGLVKVEDEVKVWIALRARVRSGGSSGK